MIAVSGTAPVSLTDSRNCANWSRKLRQLSLPDPVLPASRPAVSPYPRRYSFHDDDLSLSRGRDELELRFSVNVNKCRMRFRSGPGDLDGCHPWSVLVRCKDKFLASSMRTLPGNRPQFVDRCERGQHPELKHASNLQPSNFRDS